MYSNVFLKLLNFLVLTHTDHIWTNPDILLLGVPYITFFTDMVFKQSPCLLWLQWMSLLVHVKFSLGFKFISTNTITKVPFTFPPRVYVYTFFTVTNEITWCTSKFCWVFFYTCFLRWLYSKALDVHCFSQKWHQDLQVK